MAPKATVPPDKEYTIPEAAERMDLASQYVRSLIRQGVLPSHRVPIAKLSQVTKHMVTEADIVKYLSIPTKRSHRRDGRNKMLFYATPAEVEQIKKLMLEAGLADLVELVRSANPIKGVPLKAKAKKKGDKDDSSVEKDDSDVQGK